MTHDFVSVRNLRFLLNEMLHAPEVLGEHDYFEEYNEETYNMVLDAALGIAEKEIFPYFKDMDRQSAKYEDGTIKVHPRVRNIITAMAEGGWIGSSNSYEQGGQQMPTCLAMAGAFIFYAAGVNGSAYAFLTQGAANLIQSFGSQDLKDYYIPNMYAGKWQGTMALTEPQAGSSLSDVTTTAYPQPDGSYRIKGQKIYISGGDMDVVDNIVHLLLARIEGAPAGTKGISLFVVPKYRQNDSGELVANDVTTAGQYEKMGAKNYVAAHLMFGEQDDCHAWLVGSENRGLSHMFQMMNEARIATGIMAAGEASAAYYASLKYAKERPQGRHVDDKDVSKPQVPIIEHADVKRMLLFQKAVVEGSIALLSYCSLLQDLHHVTGYEDHFLLLDLLTPIAKTYPSEAGIDAVSQGLQVLGGAGFTKDFPLEQIYREIRINAIYEGTTGIQGMDLLGRKVTQHNGKAFKLLMQAIKGDLEASVHDQAKPWATKLQNATKQVHGVTLDLLKVAQSGEIKLFLADATLYLEMFGLMVMGWMWFKQGNTALLTLENGVDGVDERNFYNGKVITMRFFYEYELPKIEYLAKRLQNTDGLTMNTRAEVLV